MKIFRLFVMLSVLSLILSGCSGPPMKLKKTADRAFKIMSSEMANITEFENYLEPLMVDMYEVSEESWCLTYEIGHLLRFSTLWEKQERDWVQTEIRPYVENCNWAR
ncbi:MAG TPA: hypothetical protein VK856_06655 [Anaerolineaceae bacterium]|nr:hypothetical protein [Anaerolineaceae bacterium]